MISDKNRFSRLLVFLVIVVHMSTAGAVAPAQEQSRLTQVIDKALADPVLAHGVQGIIIQSLKDGRVLYEKNADLVFIPASNFKLIVSAAALDTLGPNYRFKTFLYVTGEQTQDGTLKGDMVLQGRGNPVLRTADLELMVAKLREIGITSIEGNIVGDDSWFDDIRLGWGWSWDDESYYYAAQISALNLNENVVDVWVRPGDKAGDPARVEVAPNTAYITIKNECMTSEAGLEKSLYVERLRASNIIRVTGKVAADYEPAGPEEAITVEGPTLYAVHRFMEMLREAGIEVKGKPVRDRRPANARFVMAHSSQPLSEILKLLNKPSDNLIAEVLLKTLGAERRMKGSSAAGEEVELAFLQKAGCDMTAISITDGSGLSRHNLVSPRNLLTLLKYMHGHRWSKVFLDSLPVAGVDGTLKGRMKGTPAQGNVRAKTGYIGRVSSLSGFVTTRSGEPLVFSIMMNNHLCRSKEATGIQDRIMTYLAGMG